MLADTQNPVFFYLDDTPRAAPTLDRWMVDSWLGRSWTVLGRLDGLGRCLDAFLGRVQAMWRAAWTVLDTFGRL